LKSLKGKTLNLFGEYFRYGEAHEVQENVARMEKIEEEKWIQ